MKKRLLTALWLATAVTARAWDAGGHMLVGQLAWEQMTPAARARSAALVRSLDARFNAGQPYNFITAGCWMDDMRALGKDYLWAKLHYVTIPWTPTGEPAEIPPPPNVVTAIEDNLKVLRDQTAPPAQQTEALGMLIHFIGDIHQPLHATDRSGDRGGNGYLIAGVPFSDVAPRQPANLHTFWDRAFRFDGVNGSVVELWRAPALESRPRAPGEGVIAREAAKLRAAYPPEKLPELAAPADAAALAKESHRLGSQGTYPPGEPPANTEARALEPDFVHATLPLAQRRVALAGYRLARLLNELFASPQ